MNSFDSWAKLKKDLNSRPDIPKCYPKAGEVWMSSVGKNIGAEQNGSGELFLRPILIMKKFNNKMFWAVPLSTKQKNLDFYLNFSDPRGKEVSLILAQMKLMSIKRIKRKIYTLPVAVFAKAKDQIKVLL